ncbi:MAG: hypothetical protein ACRDFB_07365 [Rhabdochlamydiaceae bacterium]
MNEKVYAKKIVKMDVSEIYEYFKQKQLPMHYFRGWEKTIRNAVGHTTFYYDPIIKKMVYEDLIPKMKRGRKIYKRKKIRSINEMIVLYDKILDVYHGVFFTNQILRVNDTCDTLAKRYP